MALRLRQILLYITMALYLGTLLLPGLVLHYEGGHDKVIYGYTILAMGWGGLFSGLMSWLGYILGIYSFIALKANNRFLALGSGCIGLVFALQSLYYQSINAQINFFDSYNTWDRGMGELSTGYYAWLAVFVLLVVQCGVEFMFNPANKLNTAAIVPQSK